MWQVRRARIVASDVHAFVVVTTRIKMVITYTPCMARCGAYLFFFDFVDTAALSLADALLPGACLDGRGCASSRKRAGSLPAGRPLRDCLPGSCCPGLSAAACDAAAVAVLSRTFAPAAAAQASLSGDLLRCLGRSSGAGPPARFLLGGAAGKGRLSCSSLAVLCCGLDGAVISTSSFPCACPEAAGAGSRASSSISSCHGLGMG